MQAVVLAGGFGTRLRSVVPDLPKPLAPVGGRPFLAYVLDELQRAGFQLVVLSVGYRHELIEQAFGARYGTMQLRYAVEDEPLGTGGAIRLAATQCTADDVFVLNGDSYSVCAYADMLNTHRRLAADITLCTAAVPDIARYGSVGTAAGYVTGFHEKGRSGPGDINAGVYVLKRALLECLGLPTAFSFERDVLTAARDRLKIAAFTGSDRFIDIGVPEDYARAQTFFGSLDSPGT